MALIKKGDHGSAVAQLQRTLNSHGAKLEVNGWFDDATEDAVATVQRRAGLVVDGKVGTKTQEVLRGQQNTKRLLEADLVAAADRLGVPLACVKAVNEVESRGSGFLDDGRPAILLERHVAYRQAKAADLAVDAMALRYPNLINPKRGGYAGGAAEWSRFDNLRSVTSLQIAIESCSWGAFQVMGYHWAALGYASAEDFQAKMMASEGNHLDAFVRYVLLDPALVKALKAKKWAEFARLYNGPAYKENLYDAKLAAAYAKAERMAA